MVLVMDWRLKEEGVEVEDEDIFLCQIVLSFGNLP